jgi:hypothetical protein
MIRITQKYYSPETGEQILPLLRSPHPCAWTIKTLAFI